MAELDHFESRLAASLERLAEEVPTDVDPQALTAAIAAAERQRGWWRAAFPGTRVGALRLAVVAAALFAFAVGMLALAQRTDRPALEGLVTGELQCTGPAWTADGAKAATLNCTFRTSAPGLAGTAELAIGPGAELAGNAVVVRPGAATLSTGDGRWSGPLVVFLEPRGMASADVVLAGEGRADGTGLHVHLMTADGLTWGISGTVGSGDR